MEGLVWEGRVEEEEPASSLLCSCGAQQNGRLDHTVASNPTGWQAQEK